ncbi:Na+/H+ antiporter subunit G, partial [Bacillaceae bacterium SAS-127]
LGIAFIFITAPVSGHLISRAAYNAGIKLSDSTIRDDLKDKNKR